MDSETTILDLKKAVDKFVMERDWKQFHNPQDLAVSISIESSELLEIFQWNIRKEMPDNKLEEVKKELADIVIYSISMANALNIDLSTAILNKIKENSIKYPVEKAKGNAKKWTELRE